MHGDTGGVASGAATDLLTTRERRALPARHPYPERTPAARALNVVGDKWALLIVQALLVGPRRFTQLQREGVRGISTEQLQTRLARLEVDGILTRTRYNEVPPRVDYELTAAGKALEPVLQGLADWATFYRPAT